MRNNFDSMAQSPRKTQTRSGMSIKILESFAVRQPFSNLFFSSYLSLEMD